MTVNPTSLVIPREVEESLIIMLDKRETSLLRST